MRPTRADLLPPLAAGLAAASVVFAAALHTAGPDRPSLPAEARTSPNVLWVVWDAARARNTTVYGYDRPTTPRLGDLAADAVVFTRARSVAPNTLPSTASAFTGVLPHNHGASWQTADNRLVAITPAPGELVTAAELAASRGLWAEAHVGNPWLTPDTGLAAGFDRYVVHDGYANTEAVTAGALDAIDALGGHGWFLYVHYIDPHAPFTPPAEHRAALSRGDYDGPLTGYDPGRLRRGELAWDDADARALTDLYDAELAYVDAELGRLLDALDARGLADDTLVIVTADHGEALGDHGTWEHRTLYDEVLTIPLVVRFGGEPITGRADPLASTVDLMPTVARWLDTPVPDQAQGRPLQEVAAGARRALTYARSDDAEAFVFMDDVKLVVTADGVELYDLRADPLEARDRSALAPDAVADRLRAANLWREVHTWDEGAATARHPVADAEARVLRTLGYVEDDR